MGFVGAFDASGHESNQPIMVVAGFVSSAQEWVNFTKNWNARLAQDGLVYLHMKEFQRWNADERKKKTLLEDLMVIISKHVFRKFGTVVEVRGMADQFSKDDKNEFRLNAYSLGGLFCVKEVGQWAARGENKGIPIEYVFEDGDIGKGQLAESVQRKGYMIHFRPGKRDRVTATGNPVPAFVPLQAADFLAGEYFKEAVRRLRGPGPCVRPQYLQFDAMQGAIRHATCGKLGQLRRTIESAKHFERLLDGTK